MRLKKSQLRTRVRTHKIQNKKIEMKILPGMKMASILDDPFSSTNVQEETMFQIIMMQEFCQSLFDDDQQAEIAAQIIQAILDARSPRLSDLSQKMPSGPDANYKRIQRFLATAEPKTALQRLFWEEANFVIGDPTEIERRRARHTDYVGVLKDGKTRGFWLLTLAVPFRGRAIPFNFVCYSSQTINEEASSRNLEHHRAFREVKMLLGERPLVLDREFSYENLLESLLSEELNFVIRLNLGSHPPHLVNDEGRRVGLVLEPGERKSYRKLYYKSEVCVNIAGEWQRGLEEPLWVMTNLDPEKGLTIYQERMKIEQAFKDLKSLLCIDKLMNKQKVYMEKMVAMVFIAYCIGFLLGEKIRDILYGINKDMSKKKKWGRKKQRTEIRSRKWKLYSGLFVLLKHKIPLSQEAIENIMIEVLELFHMIVRGNVRSCVLT